MGDRRWIDGGRLGDWDLRGHNALLTWILSREVPLRVEAVGILYRYHQVRPVWVWLARVAGCSYRPVDARRLLFTSSLPPQDA